MTRSTVAIVLRWATAAVHLTLAPVLILMSAPTIWAIVAQVQSGFVPSGYWLLPALVLYTQASAVLVLIGIVRWWRGTRRLLVAIDIAVAIASWSIFLPFVFSNDLPIVAVVLSPVALALAGLGPVPGPNRMHDERGDRSRPD